MLRSSGCQMKGAARSRRPWRRGAPGAHWVGLCETSVGGERLERPLARTFVTARICLNPPRYLLCAPPAPAPPAGEDPSDQTVQLLLGRQLEGEADERDPEDSAPAVEADDPGRGVGGVKPAGERSFVIPEVREGYVCARGGRRGRGPSSSLR